MTGSATARRNSSIKPSPFQNPSHLTFSFAARSYIRTTLADCRTENNINEEETLEIEYFESVLLPRRMTTLPHEDWVSSVSCRIPQHFLTALYDGHVRLFDHAQQLVSDFAAHKAPITFICAVPTSATTDDSILIASASHDLTASLNRVSLVPDASPSSQALASLHLHTLPLSSVAADHTGSHLLTASWDHLIGFWDTAIPLHDEVTSTTDSGEANRKKRRRLGGEGDQNHARRKAPRSVFKSHTARVSKAAFFPESTAQAYSCGFDSTARSWDVASGVCTHMITVAERPMLDLAVAPDGHTVLASSTDRTVSLFDFCSPSLASTSGTLVHPATPSCLVYPSATALQLPDPGSTPTPGSQTLVLTGAYDGIARLWDLHSLKQAIASMRAWDGVPKKILSVDWVGEVMGVGGKAVSKSGGPVKGTGC